MVSTTRMRPLRWITQAKGLRDRSQKVLGLGESLLVSHTTEFNGLTPTKAYKSILSNQASVQKGLSPTETTIRGDSHTPRQCKGRRILRKPRFGKGSQLISWFKWPHRCLWSFMVHKSEVDGVHKLQLLGSRLDQ
jgi:hypothetical protein